MKRRKNKYITITLILFALIMIIISTAYAILSKRLKIVGKVTLGENSNTNKGYNVTYVIRNKWTANNKYIFQISMTLENNTDELLDGWKISIENPENGEVLNYYNVNCNVTANTIEFSNVSYNVQVPSKGKVTFEFQIATTNPYYKPENIIINGSSIEKTEEPEQKNIQVNMEKEGQWGTEGEYYTQIKLVVKNIGNTEVHSWQFDIKFEKVNSNQYTISNSDYNGMIQPNAEISFGGIIKSSKPENKFEIINIKLN